jgi:hypothetical protein
MINDMHKDLMEKTIFVLKVLDNRKLINLKVGKLGEKWGK